MTIHDSAVFLFVDNLLWNWRMNCLIQSRGKKSNSSVFRKSGPATIYSIWLRREAFDHSAAIQFWAQSISSRLSYPLATHFRPSAKAPKQNTCHTNCKSIIGNEIFNSTLRTVPYGRDRQNKQTTKSVHSSYFCFHCYLFIFVVVECVYVV